MSCRLSREGTEISLEPKVMELLAFLAAREGRVAAKAEILEGVWAGRFVVETVVTRAVCMLRKALGDSARRPSYVETIPRRGYRVVAPVRWHEPEEAEGGQLATVGGGADARWTLWTGAEQVGLRDGETILGRDDGVDVVLDAADVSRRHARITVAGGRAVLEDLGSRNGTFLNGTRLSKPVPLRHLDVIQAASERLTVHARTLNVETESSA